MESVLWREGFHGKQSIDETLYSKRNKGSRGFKSFKEFYNETKARMACYMAAATKEWIRVTWGNESQKEKYQEKNFSNIGNIQ